MYRSFTRALLCCLLPVVFSLAVHAQGKADFNIAIKPILTKEGGYVSSKHASWGETYCGITRRTHPEWDGWSVIDKRHPKRNEILPELDQSVHDFYRINYWDRIGGDKIISQKKAGSFLHTAVKKGVERAIMHEEAHHGMKRTGVISDELIAAINKHH